MATAYHQPAGHHYRSPDAYYDPESGSTVKATGLAAFAEKTVRVGFVRKVFGLLAAQLALTTVIAGGIVFNAAAKKFVESNPAVLLLSFVLSFGIILAFSFSATARQSHPTNLVLMFAFTAAEGVLVGAASAHAATDIVVLAFAITAGITAAMTIYALTTKNDITMAGSFLYSLLWSVILAGMVGYFVRTSAFNILVSGAGALLFSVYIAYDVQCLLGGEHKFAVSPDEYVMGAISIYLDTINLFLHILRILSSSRE